MAIINMFKDIKANICQRHEHILSINGEIEIIQNNSVQILELKRMVTEGKKSLATFKSTVYTIKES